jgi:hypothetical protein
VAVGGGELNGLRCRDIFGPDRHRLSLASTLIAHDEPVHVRQANDLRAWLTGWNLDVAGSVT